MEHPILLVPLIVLVFYSIVCVCEDTSGLLHHSVGGVPHVRLAHHHGGGGGASAPLQEHHLLWGGHNQLAGLGWTNLIIHLPFNSFL